MSYPISIPAQLPRTLPRLLIPGLAAATLAVGMPGFAAAHDAKPTAARPEGWSYPFAVPSDNDRR